MDGRRAIAASGPCHIVPPRRDARVAPEVPERVGPYVVLRCIGRGGMSAVYAATHAEHGGRVALKLLRPEVQGDAEPAARLLREAYAAMRVPHPAVVSVRAVAQHEGAPYLVMELVEGADLAAVLRRHRRLPAAVAADLLAPIAAALASAHGAEVAHGDVKPSNILVARAPSGAAVARLVDFGIARVVGEAPEPRPSDGAVIGTLAYMAPERTFGEPATPAADVFALGVTLYEVVTGKKPFRAGSAWALAEAIRRGDPLPPSAHVPTPRAFDELVLRALAVAPGERPTAAELTVALASLAARGASRAPAALIDGCLGADGLAAASVDELRAAATGTLRGVVSSSALTLVRPARGWARRLVPIVLAGAAAACVAARAYGVL